MATGIFDREIMEVLKKIANLLQEILAETRRKNRG